MALKSINLPSHHHCNHHLFQTLLPPIYQRAHSFPPLFHHQLFHTLYRRTVTMPNGQLLRVWQVLTYPHMGWVTEKHEIIDSTQGILLHHAIHHLRIHRFLIHRLLIRLHLICQFRLDRFHPPHSLISPPSILPQSIPSLLVTLTSIPLTLLFPANFKPGGYPLHGDPFYIYGNHPGEHPTQGVPDSGATNPPSGYRQLTGQYPSVGNTDGQDYPGVGFFWNSPNLLSF